MHVDLCLYVLHLCSVWLLSHQLVVLSAGQTLQVPKSQIADMLYRVDVGDKLEGYLR